MGKRFEELTTAELEKLRPIVGDARIDARLREMDAPDVTQRKPKSTDPRDRMKSQTELRMATLLDMRVRAGEIVRWDYEALTFRIGIERTRYTPDFILTLPGGEIEALEVKNIRSRRSIVAYFQSAAKQYPWASWRWLTWVNADNRWHERYYYRRSG